MSNSHQNLALVLSGGGARGAYEAGILHYIRTMLPKEISQKRRFDILCGSSVGAINTCLLASMAHDLTHQGHRIYEAWKNLSQADIYKRDMMSLAGFAARSFFSISKNVVLGSPNDNKSFEKRKHFRGILDTSPMVPFLKNGVAWNQISVNIRNKLIKAVSVTATNIQTGHLELFVEKHPDVQYTGAYEFHDIKLEYRHAMASAALPLLFKPIRIKNCYYMDGSVRLNTPMSPAIQLGADRLIVIGMHHRGENVENPDLAKIDRDLLSFDAPTLGLMLGKILSALFLDRLDYDLDQMRRINRIIEWGEGCYGPEFLNQINQHLLDAGITGDVASRGLKKLKALTIHPSKDLREVFLECVDESSFFSKELTTFERTLLKVLDVDIRSSKDFLSFIMFHPKYLNRLLELGFEDARSRHNDLIEFMGAGT